MDAKINISPIGEELVLRTGTAPEVFQYKGFKYQAENVKSFVDLVKVKSSPEHGIVFYNENCFFAVIDDTVQDREQDHVFYAYIHSVQFKEWSPMLLTTKAYSIKDFADFLKRREPHEIPKINDLLYAVQNFRYVTNIQGDFSFEDRNNYTFNVKINEAEGTVRVPRTINTSIEIFKDSGFFQNIEVEIEVHRPKDQDENPGFILSCPKFARYYEGAKKHEVDTLLELLPDYLVVAGEHISRVKK